MTKYLLCAATFGLLISVNQAMAQDSGFTGITADPASSSYLSLGLGEYGIFDGSDSATDFRVEYRSGNKLFWEIKPWAGLEATTDGSIWAGGGLLADFKVAPKIYLTPSIGAGLYTEGSSDLDLGSALEFRTQLEGGYEFNNGHRLGVAFSHMSNAGIDDQNPGTETLSVYYNIPIVSLF